MDEGRRELARMLRAAREAKERAEPGEWTQRRLAGRLQGNVPGQSISNYEGARQIPDTNRMAELIVLLDLDEACAWRAYLDAHLTPARRDGLARRPGAWVPGR
jgi:hypothetical protein